MLQADAYGGYNQLYEAGRTPGPILEAACWAHARRPFFALADIEASARRKAEGKAPAPISPLALEAVRRIDALFEIERGINGLSADERRAVRQELSRAAGRRSRSLDARRAAEALARQRCRQGHGLHAQALDRLHALPRRRPHLPVEQCRRARIRGDRDDRVILHLLLQVSVNIEICFSESTRHGRPFRLSAATTCSTCEVGGTDLVWCVGHDLLAGEDAGFDELAN